MPRVFERLDLRLALVTFGRFKEEIVIALRVEFYAALILSAIPGRRRGRDHWELCSLGQCVLWRLTRRENIS
jgi:hypothetical protein